MNGDPDFRALVPVEQMVGEDDEETAQLQAMLEEARGYLLSFRWCKAISQEFFGLGIGGVVAVFLFEVDALPEVDTTLWVVVGDLPSAYLVTDQADDPRDALHVYCALMEEWVRAVRARESLADVFPIEAQATEQNANRLEKRIAFLRNEVIPHFS